MDQAERDLQPPPLAAGQRLHQPLVQPAEVELAISSRGPPPRVRLADPVQRGLVEQFLDDQALGSVPPIVCPIACGT